jgi:ferredoxin
MRIVVDLDRWQGCAQCVPLAPKVLKLNAEEAPVYPDESPQQILRAPVSSPAKAIIVGRLHDRGGKAAS